MWQKSNRTEVGLEHPWRWSNLAPCLNGQLPGPSVCHFAVGVGFSHSLHATAWGQQIVCKQMKHSLTQPVYQITFMYYILKTRYNLTQDSWAVQRWQILRQLKPVVILKASGGFHGDIDRQVQYWNCITLNLGCPQNVVQTVLSLSYGTFRRKTQSPLHPMAARRKWFPRESWEAPSREGKMRT